jgi:hypothetical protein
MLDRGKISTLTCGIRYERTFRVSDIAGSIFDTILHSTCTPFGTDFFPKYQEISNQDRMLLNDEREHYFRISTSDIIFQYKIFQEDGLDGQMNWFKNDAMQFVINEILSKNKIKNIIRIGFMIDHIIEGENLGGKILQQLSNGEMNTADQFTLRFGNKDITADGLTKKGVDDYVNRLTTIKENDENKYKITYDYQYYFIPKYDDLKDWDINAFFDKALSKLDNKFYELINSLLYKMV